MEKIKKSDHFYLIDGSGYIFRAYYALPPLTRKSDGLPVGAVSGFCNMLFKLLEDSKSNDNLEKCVGLDCYKCCEDQKNKSLYPELNGPDYAFHDDFVRRNHNKNELKNLKTTF